MLSKTSIYVFMPNAYMPNDYMANDYRLLMTTYIVFIHCVVC